MSEDASHYATAVIVREWDGKRNIYSLRWEDPYGVGIALITKEALGLMVDALNESARRKKWRGMPQTPPSASGAPSEKPGGIR